MVKGISKQVIVVNSPDKELFEQAIFILSDEAMKGNGISNEMLLREANRLIRDTGGKNGKNYAHSIMLAFGGALLMGIIWFLTSIL